MTGKTPLMDFDELKRRSFVIRELLKTYKVKLVAGEGFQQALAEAEAIADAVTKGEKGTEKAFVESARAASIVWNLSETLRPCLDHGLDPTQHLKQITTGSVDYGTPAGEGENKKIFFKDFELELFAAAECIKHGMKVALNPVSNDPSGDLFIEPLRAEVKHPNSSNQLVKLLKKFNGKLNENDRFGVFVVGLEDAFKVDPGKVFSDEAEWRAWLESKASEVEEFGKTFLQLAAKLPRILVVVQTWTVWFQADGAVNLRRQGNAVLFDEHANVPEAAASRASEVAAAFNPNFRYWSKIKDTVTAVQPNPSAG
ncbi:hypothetical protein [Novipirellula rosea]